MSNPQLGTPELVSAQSQPEVKVNAADRALSQAVGGEISIEFASDANYTLQITDPPDPGDEWAFGTIIMTDSVGPTLTAARDVIYPDVDTEYGGPSRLRFMFVNETAQILTIKRSGQTGVAVPAGESRLVRHDGTDIVEVAAAGGGGGGGAATAFDVSFFFPGEPANSQLMFKFVATRGFTFPADFDGARGHIGVNPTSAWSGDVQVAGASVGTIAVSTGGVFTFTTVGNDPVEVSAGEEVEVIGPSSADATSADFGVTLPAELN